MKKKRGWEGVRGEDDLKRRKDLKRKGLCGMGSSEEELSASGEKEAKVNTRNKETD